MSKKLILAKIRTVSWRAGARHLLCRVGREDPRRDRIHPSGPTNSFVECSTARKDGMRGNREGKAMTVLLVLHERLLLPRPWNSRETRRVNAPECGKTKGPFSIPVFIRFLPAFHSINELVGLDVFIASAGPHHPRWIADGIDGLRRP